MTKQTTTKEKEAIVIYSIFAFLLLLLGILSKILSSRIHRLFSDELRILDHQYSYSFSFLLHLTTIFFMITLAIYISFIKIGFKIDKRTNLLTFNINDSIY